MSKQAAQEYFHRIYGSHIPFDEPVHHGYTLQELQLIVFAVAYEQFETSLVSDNTYDRECETYAGSVQKSDRNIAQFDENTGMWASAVLEEEGDWVSELTENVIDVTGWFSKGTQSYHHTHLLYCIGWAPAE